MVILAIGDVVSSQGCDYLQKELWKLKKEYKPDLVIVNGENSAIGNGILPQSAQQIFDSGADVITLGNHALKRSEIYPFLDSRSDIIRPANFHKSAPGNGCALVDLGRTQAAVINLQGTVYLDNLESPFDAADREIEFARKSGAKIIIVDFHAEATAEKRALAFYLDGKVSAVFGTHTHVQTNDAQILPCQTAYISDIGMTGPYYSVLGVEPALAIEKIRTNLPVRFKNPDGPCVLEGCVMEIDEKSGLAVSIQAIRR